MKCRGNLYRDVDYDVPFCTGYILWSHAASANNVHGLDTNALCYLAEWKHVLVYGRRISTAAYRVQAGPVMDHERSLEDPCQDLPDTAINCIKFVLDATDGMGADDITKLCHSVMPSIATNSGEPVDMVRAAEAYRELDLYEPEKQESL